MTELSESMHLSDPSERDWRETEEIFRRKLSVSDRRILEGKSFVI